MEVSFLMVILIHVLTLSFLTYSLTTPWVRAYVVVNQTYYDIKMPIDIGVIKCYSDICDEYLLWKKESKKEKSKDSSSYIHSSTDNDHAIDDYVHQVERPFVIASIITLIFITVGGMSSFLGLSAAIYNTFIQPNQAMINLHVSIILFSASTILIGSLLYVLFTFSSLHGGYYYAAGVYGMAYMTVINILFSILIAMNEQKRQGYSRIVEMPARASNV